MSTLFQVMAWCYQVYKPLSAPILTSHINGLVQTAKNFNAVLDRKCISDNFLEWLHSQIQNYLLGYGSLGPTGHDPYGSQSTGNGSHHWCFWSLEIFRCIPRMHVVGSPWVPFEFQWVYDDSGISAFTQSVCLSVSPFRAQTHTHIMWMFYMFIICAGLILGLHPANERSRYKGTLSPIGWAQT